MFSGPESSSSVPAFVAKLWQMVCDPKYDDLISWCDNGSSFVIKDQLRFCSELLPMYYKHNNMASFIRQLNKYGFRKVVSVNSATLKGDMSDFEFCHPRFIRGCPVLLEQIKRKVSISRDVSEYRTDQGLLAKLLLEVQQMHQKQSAFEARITSMKAENDALWREHSILRQKHQKQQKIVNRLIHFLLSLVHQTRGVNVKRRNMPLMLKDGTCLPIEGLVPVKEGFGTTPVICEINPCDVFSDPNSGKEGTTFANGSNIDVIIPGSNEVDSKLVKNSDDILLEVPSQSTLAFPLQEVVPSVSIEPNIVKTKTEPAYKKLLSFSGPISKVPEKKGAGLTGDKRLVKVRKIAPNVQNTNLLKIPTISSNIESKSQRSNAKIFSKKNIIPKLNKQVTSKSQIKVASKKSLKTNRNREITTSGNIELLDRDHGGEKLYSDDSQDSLQLDDPLKLDSDIPGVNIFDNDIGYAIEDQTNLLSPDPIILSPSGSQILSPGILETPVKEENTNTSLVVSEHNSPISKQDVESHIDLMQSDIEALKEILHGEGLSLDASTIFGLFGSEDPLSLNMPEAGKNSDKLNTSPVGNELVTYSPPSIIDFADGLDEDDIPTANDSSFIDNVSSSLNTPQSTFTLDFPSPSLSKRLKK